MKQDKHLLDTFVGAAMMMVAFKILTERNDAAKTISDSASGFTEILRIAQGLPPEPTTDEKIERRVDEFMLRDNESWSEFE